MSIQSGHRISRLLRVIPLLSVALTPALAAGQVPIHGVTGTMALPGDVDKVYSGINKLSVKVTGTTRRRDGETKKKAGASVSLEGLQPGTPVAVREREGIVSRVDPLKNRVTVNFTDGDTETFRPSRHAPDKAEQQRASASHVVMYYIDQSGERVGHYLKRVSR
jgi:hypothetical protein